MVGNLANYSNLHDPVSISMLDLAISIKELYLKYYCITITFNLISQDGVILNSFCILFYGRTNIENCSFNSTNKIATKKCHLKNIFIQHFEKPCVFYRIVF